MSEEKITYPLQTELKIYITDGYQVGSVSFGVPFSTLPTDGDMEAIFEKVKAALPDGFRIMDRAESFMHYLREERGYRGPNMVAPKLGKWYDPATDNDYTSLNDEEEIYEDE